ncbi:hypothetical protein [Microbacterium terricola]|uniref:Uncharacterized protein n=1 Tax=Microbacterium terricola TaxID=344163 RepID=A0ABM8DZ71_9MICO|nr:hypothetical protein [Microbacterium terricola]UYK41258.1 hypothetical protein OAU46_06385 [Microbacterium terricola]BDV30963.1 hypothetical protein Microterr_16230 [Microbacterium terricola]
MGLFTQRPEEPTEWAGLPSEPLRPRSLADQLPEAPDDDALGLVTGDAVQSISIPLPAPANPPSAEASDGDAGEGDGGAPGE